MDPMSNISAIAPSDFLATLATQENLYQTLVTKYLFLGAFTAVVYDHACTLSEEVEAVWKKKRKTLFLYLFIFVRYYAPLALGVVTFGLFSTFLTQERCSHWMYFGPLGVTVPLMILPSILMAVRVYALWNKSKLMLAGLLLYLMAQTIISVWATLLPGGAAVPMQIDNYEFHYCIFISDPRLSPSMSSIYILMELSYDAMIFLLTVSRVIYLQRKNSSRGLSTMSLMRSLARDGALYFAGIFAVNLIWVLLLRFGTSGMHGFMAMPSCSITVVLISRITLNLRQMVYGPPQLDERTVDGILLQTLDTAQRGRSVRHLPLESHRGVTGTSWA